MYDKLLNKSVHQKSDDTILKKLIAKVPLKFI